MRRLQVSGLMLASHTSIRHLFSKCISQYEKLRKKQAFLDNYRKFPMFAVSVMLIFRLHKLACIIMLLLQDISWLLRIEL